MNKKVAYCIPTYNSPDKVEKILRNIAAACEKYDVDIYVYDSSQNNETHEVVKSFQEKGYINIFHVKIEAEVALDEKLILILSGYGLKNSYTYIWLVKNRVFYGEETIKEVCAAAKEEFDAIFLGVSRHPDPYYKKKHIRSQYHDAAEFYLDWGWLATSMDVTVFHYKSLLANMDWQEFRKKYFLNGFCSFDHYVALFEGLSAKKEINVKVLSGSNIVCRVVDDSESAWIPYAFKTWVEMWSYMNKALPMRYEKYKREVIKQAACLPWILGSYEMLITLEQEGILNDEIAAGMRGRWEEFTNITNEESDMIMKRQYKELHYILKWKIEDSILKGEPETALYLVQTNPWLGSVEEDPEYIMLVLFLQIYREEELDGCEKGIFWGMKNLDEIYERYFAVRNMLRRMEYGIAQESWADMGDYIIRNHISSWFLTNVAKKRCMDETKVMNKLISVLEG